MIRPASQPAIAPITSQMISPSTVITILPNDPPSQAGDFSMVIESLLPIQPCSREFAGFAAMQGAANRYRADVRDQPYHDWQTRELIRLRSNHPCRQLVCCTRKPEVGSKPDYATA